jgi:hypothetical protein
MEQLRHSVQIGNIFSCIDGDSRYTSIIDVQFNTRDGSIDVMRLESAPSDGMDGSGRPESAVVKQRATLPNPTGSQLVKAIKMVMDDTVKRYGKPTKSFEFMVDGVHVQGLNARNAQRAIDSAKHGLTNSVDDRLN